MEETNPKVWCLKVEIAHPDYKRPYANFHVFHFKTEMEAIQKEREMRIQFCLPYKDYEDSDLESDSSDDEDEKARKRKGRVNIDDLTKEEKDEWLLKKFDKICEGFYGDSYMDMDPYSSEIFLVKV